MSKVEEMENNLIVSFIGEDRPGLVEEISEVVVAHEGNWLESRMAKLAGKFTGIIQIAVGSDSVHQLDSALQNLKSPELELMVEIGSSSADESGNLLTLSILGLDRPGIVRDVTQALSEQGANILEMSTDIMPAAMTGGSMFNATAIIEGGLDQDLDSLMERLEAVALALGVDIDLSEDLD